MSIVDYVSGDYLIIKLHGSINWAHEVTNFRDVGSQAPWRTVTDVIERIPELELSKEYRIISAVPMIEQQEGNLPLFPALSIPVENKQGYECPAEHLQALKECLPRVTKLLIIGWRGAEDPFLKLLADGLRKASRIMVVSSSEGKANDVITRIRNAGVMATEFLAAKGGFSQVITGGEAEGFLKQ